MVLDSGPQEKTAQGSLSTSLVHHNSPFLAKIHFFFWLPACNLYIYRTSAVFGGLLLQEIEMFCREEKLASRWNKFSVVNED